MGEVFIPVFEELRQREIGEMREARRTSASTTEVCNPYRNDGELVTSRGEERGEVADLEVLGGNVSSKGVELLCGILIIITSS